MLKQGRPADEEDLAGGFLRYCVFRPEPPHSGQCFTTKLVLVP